MITDPPKPVEIAVMVGLSLESFAESLRRICVEIFYSYPPLISPRLKLSNLLMHVVPYLPERHHCRCASVEEK